MTPPTTPRRRLLIGATSFTDAQAALHLTERLAETLAGDLCGILVEETIVTEIVDLPGQRVVTSSGTLVVAPSSQQVRTFVESDARLFHDTLSDLARNKERDWSFERRHGDLIAGLCEAAKGWDILLLGHREINKRHGKVVLVAPPMTASQRAVELAEGLASALRADLVAITIGSENASTAQRQVFSTEAALLAHINRTNTSVVVMDLSAGPLHTHDQLRHLLSVARCPVLVFGASGDPPEPDE